MRSNYNYTSTSTESEFKGLFYASQEAVYLRQLLQEMSFRPSQETTIFEDNEAAIKIAYGNIQDTKLKHVKIQYFAVQEWIKDQKLIVRHIPSNEQLADFLTKALDSKTLASIRDKVLSGSLNV